MLPAPVQLLVEHHAGGDSSAALALAALLRAADDSGCATLDAMAESYRRHYLASLRAAGKDAEREAGLLGVDAVRQHLARVILPRLVHGELVTMPADVLEPGACIRVTPRVWDELGGHRAAVVEVLRQTGEHAVINPTIAASPAPVTVGGSVLEATGLVKMYRRRKVVNDVALRLQQGEIVGLLGPNGAGKTTTFYMIVGLIQPMAGRIMLDGRGHHRDAHVPAGTARYRLSVAGTVDLPKTHRGGQHPRHPRDAPHPRQRTPPAARDAARRAEHQAPARSSRAYALSGGERRRLEITRALVTQPKFMMLDEPFAGVDPIAVHDIQTIVADLRHRGIGVLISDHNVEQTLDIVDRAYIMFDGQVKVSRHRARARVRRHGGRHLSRPDPRRAPAREVLGDR